MDPDECLAEIRRQCAIMANEPGFTGRMLNAASALQELAVAMDEWLVKGGFPPKAWSHGGIPPEIHGDPYP
jgi:hypothetical protein